MSMRVLCGSGGCCRATARAAADVQRLPDSKCCRNWQWIRFSSSDCFQCSPGHCHVHVTCNGCKSAEVHAPSRDLRQVGLVCFMFWLFQSLC
jgi:hypothetical protein